MWWGNIETTNVFFGILPSDSEHRSSTSWQDTKKGWHTYSIRIYLLYFSFKASNTVGSFDWVVAFARIRFLSSIAARFFLSPASCAFFFRLLSSALRISGSSGDHMLVPSGKSSSLTPSSTRILFRNLSYRLPVQRCYRRRPTKGGNIFLCLAMCSRDRFRCFFKTRKSPDSHEIKQGVWQYSACQSNNFGTETCDCVTLIAGSIRRDACGFMPTITHTASIPKESWRQWGGQLTLKDKWGSWVQWQIF